MLGFFNARTFGALSGLQAPEIGQTPNRRFSFSSLWLFI
jgi:hypothetical protein